MLRETLNLISEAVEEGHGRGVSLFMENLEEDLAKEQVFEENGGVDPVMAQLFEEAGVEVEDLEAIEEMDEEKVDKMLQDLETGDDE